MNEQEVLAAENLVILLKQMIKTNKRSKIDDAASHQETNEEEVNEGSTSKIASSLQS